MTFRDESTGAPEGSEAQAPEDRIAALEAALANAEANAKANLDGWQRERATFQNFRRRSNEESVRTSQVATEDVLCQILPLLDDLDRALGEATPEQQDEPWLEGVRMVRHKFQRLLSSLGVEPIEAEGCRFDPSRHEAVTHEEAAGHEPGDIIQEVLRGYRAGERILRYSAVRVAK